MCPEFDPEAFREFERQGHDRLAESYTDVFTPITGLAIGHLLDAASAKPGMKVLDVACGPGNVCQAAIGRGVEPAGIDLSPRMVEIAGRLMPDVRFLVADVQRLPFEQASFDAVVCNFGLGHFPRPEASVAECVRVLAPGCMLAFSWWDSLQKQQLQAIFRAALSDASATPSPRIPTGHDVFRFCNTAALRGLLEGAGLEQVSISDHATSIEVEDAQHLWEIGMGSLAVTSSIILDSDAATQNSIRLAFDQICESYRDGSTLRIPIAFKIAVGRKP
jgi:SAM-dependent methyltransferase